MKNKRIMNAYVLCFYRKVSEQALCYTPFKHYAQI